MPYFTFEHTLALYFSSSPASLYQNIQKPPKLLETDISCAERKTFSLSLSKLRNQKQNKRKSSHLPTCSIRKKNLTAKVNR